MDTLFSGTRRPRLHSSAYIVVMVIIIGASTFAAYQYQQQNNILAQRVTLLENQMTSFSTKTTMGNSSGEATEQTQDELITKAVAKASPAVVSVTVLKEVPTWEIENSEFIKKEGARPGSSFSIPILKQIGTEKQQVGAGTGFFVHPDGYILTNRHVVGDTDMEYNVLLSSNTSENAEIVYRDPVHDIAILKISGSGYSTINFGDSASLQLGKTVAAIGNALGEYNNSVSVGIISGLDRTIEINDAHGESKTLSGIIQTDAAINLGNSGGPLLNLDGDAIGINIAVEQGASNIAFAIPIHMIQPIISNILP